jgi:hypothetical protein
MMDVTALTVRLATTLDELATQIGGFYPNELREWAANLPTMDAPDNSGQQAREQRPAAKNPDLGNCGRGRG